MITRILIIILLFNLERVKAQVVSTVFLDTLNITVNDKKIYTSNETNLKFIPNNNDVKLTVYNDGIYKLVVNFVSNKPNNYSALMLSDIHFFCHDTIYLLRQVQQLSAEYEACSGMLIASYLFQNLQNDKSIPSEKIQVKIHYRLFNLAPKDTANYKYNYRQGLWIGGYKDAKVVTVNYNNDKKEGLAKAVYKDSISYQVNFKNNIADNYGRGYWDVSGKKGRLKLQYTIPNIIVGSCDSIKNQRHESFYFEQGKKWKEVHRYNGLSIYSIKRGVHHDSIEYHSSGDFLAVINDTIILNSDAISEHNFYKKNTDSTHYLLKEFEREMPVKIPLNEISKVYYSRGMLQDVTIKTTLLSLFTGFIVSPLISIQKNGFNRDRFAAVSGTSMGVMVLSITVAAIFGQKGFLIQATKKNKKVWIIQPD
jgi:hypothetical protein